jgi:hypothetical protein
LNRRGAVLGNALQSLHQRNARAALKLIMAEFNQVAALDAGPRRSHCAAVLVDGFPPWLGVQQNNRWPAIFLEIDHVLGG